MAARTSSKERINPEIGRRLRQRREILGLSQKDVAERIGITTGAYQNYEYGKEILSGRLIQICAVLECSPNWLLGVKDEGMNLDPDSLLLHQLRDAFNRLNEEGQQEAVKRVTELSELPRYTEAGEKEVGSGSCA